MKYVFPKITDITQKRIAVYGYGVEGIATTKFLHTHGGNITIFDNRPKSDFPAGEITLLGRDGIQWEFGSDPDFSGFDAVIRSPGIMPNCKPLIAAQQKGIPITTATQLFLDFCPVPVIGVTGTKGKGTTSSLISEMLTTSERHVYLGGNIGVPTLSFLDDIKTGDWVVLELSSFQLMDLESSPHIAVVLMVTVEHQDYHASPEEYVAAKSRLVQFQQASDYTVSNTDYINSDAIGAQAPSLRYAISITKAVSKGCYVQNGVLVFADGNTKENLIPVREIFIPGKHNWENAAAAACAAKLAGVSSEKIRQVLRTFKGLSHRLEYVKTICGVRYFDDSFSTTPETAMAALAAFQEPKILILGGSSKNSDFAELGRHLAASTSLRAIIGIGKEWTRIKASIPNGATSFAVIEHCRTMSEIVQAAKKVARSGDVVVLSPACASFDMFKNYKDRGDQFKQQVLNVA